MKRFVNFMRTEETAKTPLLDKIMLVAGLLEVSIIIFFIAFLVKLGTMGMII